MIRYFELGLVFIFLFAGMLLLLVKYKGYEKLRAVLNRAKSSVEERDRKTKYEIRNRLISLEEKSSLWLRLERELEYSGLKRRLGFMSAGKFIVVNIILIAGLGILGISFMNLPFGLLPAGGFVLGEFILIQYLKYRNMRLVNEELPKFLDFLGNYSVTAGDIAAVFMQISRYLKYPLQNVLEEFSAESSISGNVSLALLSMADKIEHPEFKQLIRNIEITSRYSTDFKGLVADSRRSLREYMAQGRDRAAMLREAGINMLLLLIMSIVVLITVNKLVEGSVWSILFSTMVGHLAIAGMIVILILFGFQAISMNK